MSIVGAIASKVVGRACALPQQENEGLLIARPCIPLVHPRHPKGDEREGEQMKRAIFFALMLITILAPLASVAHADLKSDEAIEQAP
jgi:hypothetical protein